MSEEAMENADDIAAALKHLGWESVADLHYWAQANDIERFEALCQSFAKHRRAADAELDRLRAENERLRRERGNALYMGEAYRQMLGPKGREVATMWEKQGVVRIHSSWAADPYSLEGEDVAQIHLDFEAAPKTPIDDIDGHIAALGEQP